MADTGVGNPGLNRRAFLLGAANVAAAAPLILIAGNNGLNLRQYASVDPSRAVTTLPDILPGVINASGRFRSALDKLSVQFRHTFYSDYFVTSCDSSPYNFPKVQAVTSWAERYSSLDDKWKSLGGGKAIDIRHLDDVTVKFANANRIEQIVLGGAVFLSLAVTLFGYDKIAAQIRGEVGDPGDTPRQMSRRALCKLGAAGIACGVYYGVHQFTERWKHSGINELNKELFGARQRSTTEAFKRYFGLSPSDMIADSTAIVRHSTTAVKEGVSYSDVTPALQNVVTTGTNYTNELKKLFGQTGFSEQMGYAIRCRQVTRAVEQIVEEGRTGTLSSIVLEGAAVAGILTGTMVMTERYNNGHP